MIQIRTSRIQLVVILGLALTIITLISTLNPFKFELLAADDPVACVDACVAETGDPYGDCYMYCNPESYGYYDGDCTYVSFMYGESNPELWCSYVDTPVQMCAGACKDVNWSYFGYETSCTDLCNSYATTSDCVDNTPMYFDEFADSSFCSLLEYGYSTPEESEFTVTGMPNDFKIVTAYGTQTISGSVTSPTGVVDSLQLYSYEQDSTSSCTLNWDTGSTYNFSCTTPNMSTNGTYVYDLKSYSYSEETVKKVYIEVGTNLIALWNFDDTVWQNDSISNLGGAIANGAVTSLNGNPLKSLDGTSGGYINYNDSTEIFSFSGADAHFKVQADVYSSDFTTGDKRVVGKYNEADNENTWLLGTYHDGGIYCAVWIGNDQWAISSNESHLTPNQWNTIACEWNASERRLTTYLDGVQATTNTVGGTEYIAPSTNYLTINGRPGGWDGFNGLVDNVKFYDLSTPSVDPEIVFTDDTSGFRRIDTAGVQTISGTVYLPEQLSIMDVYNADLDEYTTCDFETTPVDGDYDFTCDTTDIQTEGTHQFEIYATDENIEITRVFTIEYGADLQAMWTFDNDTDFEDDVINGLDATLVAPASQHTQGYSGKALDTLSGGRINYLDSDGDFSYDTETSHFKVEAMVKTSNFAQGGQRVVGKYNEAGDENSWLMGTNDGGGIYCAVWIDGNQESLDTAASMTNNIWNKIACEWNANDRTLKAYINDVEEGSRVLGGTANLASSTNYLTINGRPDGNDSLDAYIDNVKLYEYAAEYVETDVPKIFVNSEDEFKVTNSTTQTSISGIVSDESLITSVESKRVGSDTWNSCTVTPSLTTFNAPSNPVGHWSLDETSGSGAYMLDSTANSNDGTPIGTTTTEGILSQARSFSGDNQYVELESSTNFPSGSDPRTVMAWVKIDSYTGALNHVFHYGNDSGNEAWGLVIWDDGQFGVHEWEHQDRTGNLTTDKWYLLAITLDAFGNKTHYQDGVNVGTLNHTPNTQLVQQPKIGSRVLTGEFFDGQIDDVYLFDRVLTEEEINEYYKSTKNNYDFTCWTGPMSDLATNGYEIRATDENGNVTSSPEYGGAEIEVDTLGGLTLKSVWRLEDYNNAQDELGFANLGTATAPASNIRGLYSGAIDFTGDRAITIPDSTGDFSFIEEDSLPHIRLEATVRNTSVTGSDKMALSKSISNGNDAQFMLGIHSSGGVLCGVWTEGGEIWTYSETQLTPDQWEHIACDWNAYTGELKSYLNGSEVKTHTTSVAIEDRNFVSSDQSIYIGNRQSWTSPFNGDIDHVKVYYEGIDYTPPFTGDGNPPIIRINPVENAEWLTDTTPTITGTITDTDTVLSANYLLFRDRNGYTDEDIDSYTWTDFLPTDGVWDEQTETFSVTLPEVTVENGYYFLVKAKDLAGTESIYLNTGWIISGDNSDYLMAFKKLNFEFEDTTAPIITLNNVQPNPTNKTSLNIKGNVKDYTLDTQSAIASIQYKLDSGTWKDAKVIASSDQNRNKDFVVELSNLSIGNHTVEVRATDAEGNLTGEGYDACYDSCIPYPNETIGSCENRCYRHTEITTKTTSFEVIATEEVSPELKRETVSFSTSRSVNNSGSSAIIGYNRARLPLTYTYDTYFEFYSNSDEFGKLYGDKVLGVSNAVDGNLWLTFNNESFGYYNITTKQLTRYPTGIYPQVGEITEFEYQGNRYLAVTQRNSGSAGIYSIGTTPENTSDDSHYDYGTLLGVNSTLHTFKRDTRSSTPAFYAIVGNTGSSTAVVLWIDTMGTMDDPSDDTYTLQTQADGLDPNMTALYFDPVKNWLIMGSYDAYRINYLDDNGTPTNKSDDTIVKSTTDQLTEDAFSITKDSNGRYWIAGNQGVHSIELNSLSELPEATYTTYLKAANLGSERAWKLQWVNNTQKKTEEFLVSTREGSVYAYDYNKTYDDLSDDKFTRYTFPPELYGSFISYEHTFTPDGNSAWMMMPAAGLYKLGITRDFTNSAEVVLWPDIDSQDKYIDQFKIESIDGTNLENIEIFVTNDGGETWIPTEIGETTRFSTSDYQVQIKIVLNKVGIDSPEVLGVNIAYATYNEDPVNESDLILDYPAQTGVGDAFETDLMLVDELGEIPNWSGDVVVNAYNAVNDSEANNCFDYESQEVAMVSGAATIQTEALCEGDYYFSGTTEDGRSANGSEIEILGTYIPDPELCGNGVLDTGEQCDYTLEETYMCEDGKTEKTCTTQCLLDDTACEQDNPLTPIINDIKDLVKDGENEDISTSISIAQVANWAIKLISLTLLTLSLPLLPYYIVRFLTGILYLLNAKKRTREYGYVYDSVTKEPISQAIIRYYIGEKLIQTDVTGIYGEFGGDLEPGNYTIVVEKPEYIFPSRLIMGSSDGQIENVYTGSLSVTNTNETTVAIPMDKMNASLIEIFKTAIINRISIGMQVLKLVIFLALLAYSIFAYQTNPSVLNIIVLIEYVILSVLILLTILKKEIHYGQVQTVYGDIVKDTKIGVYETEFNKLITQRVTDDKGRYRFILKPGEYRLETLNSNYKLSQETVLKLEDKPSIINRDLTLEPK